MSSKQFQVQSIVFDLFHTLVDPEDYRPRDFKRSEKIADLFKLDKEEFRKYWDSMLNARCTSGSRKVLSYVEEYVTKVTGKSPSKQDLIFAELVLGRYQDLAIEKPRPMLIGALSALKSQGIKLGLLSDSDEREVRAWPKSTIVPFFDSCCFSFEIGYTKPSKEAYSIVLDKLGATAQSSIFVGDGGGDELKGAREAGFGAVVFMKGFVSKNGLRSAEEIRNFSLESDYTIDTLGELVLVIDKVQGKLKF